MPSDSPPSLFAPFGLSVGDQLVPPGDDISEGPILLEKPFRFFGKSETEVYVCLHQSKPYYNTHFLLIQHRLERME